MTSTESEHACPMHRPGAASFPGEACLPPGPVGAPQALLAAWSADPYGFLFRCRDAHGDCFTVDLGPFGKRIVFSAPHHLKALFTAPDGVLLGARGNEVLAPIVGKSSAFVLDGPAHLACRRLMLPAFTGAALDASGSALLEAVDASLEEVESAPRVIDMVEYASRVLLRATVRLLFPHGDAGLVDGVSAALGDIGAMLRADTGSMGAGMGGLRAGKARLDEILAPFLAGRRATLRCAVRAPSEAPHMGNFVDRCLQAGLGDDAIRDQIVTLLAAQDASATTVAWGVHFLFRYPVIHAALVAAAAEVDLSAPGAEIPGLSHFVMEVLRLRPPAPMASRGVGRPITIGEYRLLPGSYAIGAILLAHHRAETFPHPERFEPARFRERKYSQYEYLPFGGGVHRCVGFQFSPYELQLVLGRLLQRCHLAPVDASDVGDPRASWRVATTSPSTGIPTRMTIRSERA